MENENENENELKIINACGIYKITSKCDGKFYIGSSVKVKNRLNRHLSSLRNNKHDNKHLQNIFNKYGENNLLCELVEYCESTQQFVREQYYVDMLYPEINIRVVEVNSKKGIPCSEETKQKISKANKGKTLSQEHKKIISESNKTRIISEETKQKRSKSLMGHTVTKETKQKNRETQGTKVVQLDKDFNIIKIWTSMGECEEFGFSHSAISNVCSGKRKSHKNFIWMKLEDFENRKEFNKPTQELGKCPSKKIIQYDLLGNKLKEFSSTKEAVLYNNIFSEEGIRSCCRGRNSSHRNFIFKYKDDADR